MNLTITTCLYDIRKKEQSTCQNISTLKDYLELSQHMLSVRLPIVVFTDEEEIAEHVYKTRLNYGLLDKTLIVGLPFEETFFYKDLEILKKRMEEFHIVNWNRDKDTPLYVLLNNNKFDFLKRSMEINPFQTEFFMWMDMGIQHCTQATEKEWLDISETWPAFIQQDRQHIHHLRIHTVTKPNDMQWKDYFRMIYHHVAGGLFGGHRDRVGEYIRLFQDQWHKILYEENWWQLDEAVITILTETYPEKFRFFYGDYDGMLSNFIHSKKSFGLVLQTAQRHLDALKHDLAEHVLNSLDFQYLVGTEYYEKALNMKICNDYHLRDGQMSPVLSDILNHQQIPLKILMEQVSNIRHMSDPALVPFFTKWARHNPINQWAWERWCNIQHRHTFEWLSFSKPLLNRQLTPLPLDVLEPRQLLTHFQSQFSSFSEEQVCALYKILETPNNKLFFVWVHHADDKTPGEQDAYDRSILDVYFFLQRNFPQLDFYMLCLYANRPWSITVEQTPSRLLVFCIEVPYSFHNNDEFYAQIFSEFFSMLRLLERSPQNNNSSHEKVFYGQHREDEFLSTLFPEGYQGICVDVGAYDGVGMSNTLYFEERGWRCLCIEPIYEEFIKCSQIRKETLNCCIADADKNNRMFTVYYVNGSTAAISSLQPDPRLIHSHQHIITSSEIRTTKVRSLTSVLDEMGYPHNIDFISIDTENTELDVLKGLDLTKYRVRYFIIENNFNETIIELYLQKLGYKKFHRIAVNDFYVLE